MRKINKLPEPESLKTKAAKWLNEMKSLLEQGKTPPNSMRYAYRAKDIKQTLIDETFGKCAYCESHLLHNAFGETDHFEPVSAVLDLLFDWNNLLLSCTKCNHNKWTYFNPDDPLIDPTKDEPSEHLFFAGAYVYPRNGSQKGARTEFTLDLNRTQLLEKRQERINDIHRMIDRWHRETPERKKLLVEQIKLEFQPQKEYSLAVENFINHFAKNLIS